MPLEWSEHRNCVTLGFPGCGCVGVSHRRTRKATGAGVVEPVDKAFEGGERRAFGGVSKSFGWVVVSILVCAVPWLVWCIAVLIGSSSSSLSPVGPRFL